MCYSYTTFKRTSSNIYSMYSTQNTIMQGKIKFRKQFLIKISALRFLNFKFQIMLKRLKSKYERRIIKYLISPLFKQLGVGNSRIQKKMWGLPTKKITFLFPSFLCTVFFFKFIAYYPLQIQCLVYTYIYNLEMYYLSRYCFFFNFCPPTVIFTDNSFPRGRWRICTYYQGTILGRDRQI